MKRTKLDKRASSKLTLRAAYDRFYDRSEITPRTIKHFSYMLNRWERESDNPPVRDIDEEYLDQFRTKLLDSGLAPASVNATRTMIRAVLRRIGPQFTGNPRGLGILERVPWMRPARMIRGLPRRISTEDLSRFYLGTRVMEIPRFAGPAPYFWQALEVTAFCTGLRKSDLFALRFADIDLERGEMQFQALKTRKAAIFPLHRIACEHIRRIQNGREYVFRCHLQAGGSLSQHWRNILQAGGVREHFTMHDIRRTGASAVEAVAPGMGRHFLQHATIDVSDLHYINVRKELGEAIDKMGMPVAFTGGIKLAERQLAKAQDDAAALMRSASLAPPVTPRPEEWRFSSSAFEVRGSSGCLKGQPMRALQALALAGGPITFNAIADAVYGDERRSQSVDLLRRHVHGVISYVRQILRTTFYLPPTFDPVPCIEKGNGGRFAVYLPASVKGGAA